MVRIDSKTQKIIQNNPAALATSDLNNRVNISVVAYLKVVDKNKILITDNFMAQTKKNILKNPKVCLAVWNKNWQGFKLFGQAKYFSTGQWLSFAKKMKENKNMPVKGAIILSPTKIMNLK